MSDATKVALMTAMLRQQECIIYFKSDGLDCSAQGWIVGMEHSTADNEIVIVLHEAGTGREWYYCPADTMRIEIV